MSLSDLNKTLKELGTGNAKNFDPMRFEYIQSLSGRLSQPQHQENIVLVEKTLSHAQQYLVDLNDQRHQADNTIKELSSNYPQYLKTAEILFEQCQFRQLEQLSARLGRQFSSDRNLTQLRDLTRSINQQAEAVNDRESRLSIEEILYQQEQRARIAAGDALLPELDGRVEQLELQSMKHFRESMKHFNIDKIIAHAINEGPENPGPLNPQMLAIKSLTHMRDLSPSYLRRFAGYIETLLWLEKNITKLNNKKIS